jgi:stress-induced morphogen
MSVSSEELRDIIASAFSNPVVNVTDTAGDQEHYLVEVITGEFVGKSLMEQHKMVNNAIRGTAAASIHSISIKTSVPK